MTVYYAIFPDGRHAFTHEQRIADAWGGAGAVVIVDPVDVAGDAFTGDPSQTISTTVDAESGNVVIDIEHHSDIVTASAIVTEREQRRIADTLTARVAELESGLAALLAWATALSDAAAT